MRLRALLALVIAVAALAGAALAWADTDVIRDGINETKALRDNGRVDIVKAIAGHHRHPGRGPRQGFGIVSISKSR